LFGPPLGKIRRPSAQTSAVPNSSPGESGGGGEGAAREGNLQGGSPGAPSPRRTTGRSASRSKKCKSGCCRRETEGCESHCAPKGSEGSTRHPQSQTPSVKASTQPVPYPRPPVNVSCSLSWLRTRKSCELQMDPGRGRGAEGWEGCSCQSVLRCGTRATFPGRPLTAAKDPIPGGGRPPRCGGPGSGSPEHILDPYRLGFQTRPSLAT
ncbi:uncharacterized protein LOC131515395, partial [Neofelis nebulosa]|uniref:uncharacterized protein LOC131515395 n=1 Tax=Neofelis nebulosa TaxID=61452 RepID=UPI00272C68D9